MSTQPVAILVGACTADLDELVRARAYLVTARSKPTSLLTRSANARKLCTPDQVELIAQLTAIASIGRSDLANLTLALKHLDVATPPIH